MGSNVIDAGLLKRMFLAGVANLESKKEWINELNVFPVPDGDTGTNMTLTILSAAREVNSVEEPTMETLAKAISSGSLRGARGNSGVILSQLFRGFTKAIKYSTEIDMELLAEALQRATETAYKAVMKPKEGTILTVAKGISDKAKELAQSGCDMDVFIQELLKEGDYVLSQTPEMLPVLKQAGVVDSGGQGLMQVLKGAYDGYLGKEITFTAEKPAASRTVTGAANDEIDTADIKFGYCTEFIIMTSRAFTHEDEKEFKAFLSSIGDSIVCVADDELVKVHVHTNDPGLAIQKALTYGQLTSMKIDNMRLEHEEKLIKEASRIAEEQKKAAEEKKDEPRKAMGFISVSIGNGVGEIFRELGVDYLIEGGQTMNPSTEDMLEAIEKVNADTVFILPNNKNIILAANQASYLCEDKKIIVVPTKTVPQGITAMISYNPDETPEANAEVMQEEIQNVKTGQVTYAVRDTKIDDKEIHEGDIMGIGDAGILAVGKSIEATTKAMMAELVDEDSEIIGIYYGEDVKEEDAQKLGDELAALYPNAEVEVHNGGQPIYYYVISVE